MDIGSLDREATFYAATLVDNGLSSNWQYAAIATEWAAKTDIRDAEKWAAGAVGATVTTRFVTRWNSALWAIGGSGRFDSEGVTYEIVGKKEIGRREGIEWTAVRTSD